MNKFAKVSIVIVCSVVVTSLTMQASDYVRLGTNQLASLTASKDEPCGTGMVLMNLESGPLCVDTYEASPATRCPVANPQNETQTQTNLNDRDCAPATQPDVLPWRFVSLAQSQQLCARVDKRLPTVSEWYTIALTLTDDAGCSTDTKSAVATGNAECVSRTGVYDLVGNVWEWTDGQVQAGEYAGRALPATGFVSLVDTEGIVLETSGTPSVEYGNDYAQTNLSGVYGIIRGGYYGSLDDAGIYAQNLAVPLNLKTAGIGFRCVRSL